MYQLYVFLTNVYNTRFSLDAWDTVTHVLEKEPKELKEQLIRYTEEFLHFLKTGEKPQ